MWEKVSYITFPKHVAIDNARLKLVYRVLLITCCAINVWRKVANKQLTSTVPLEVIPRLRGVSYMSLEPSMKDTWSLCKRIGPLNKTRFGMNWTWHISCQRLCEKSTSEQSFLAALNQTRNCVLWPSLVQESRWERMLVTTSETSYTSNFDLFPEAATTMYPWFSLAYISMDYTYVSPKLPPWLSQGLEWTSIGGDERSALTVLIDS